LAIFTKDDLDRKLPLKAIWESEKIEIEGQELTPLWTKCRSGEALLGVIGKGSSNLTGRQGGGRGR